MYRKSAWVGSVRPCGCEGTSKAWRSPDKNKRVLRSCHCRLLGVWTMADILYYPNVFQSKSNAYISCRSINKTVEGPSTRYIVIYFVWLMITDEGSVSKMRIWSILLIKSDFKWCIHLSRSLFLYLDHDVKVEEIKLLLHKPHLYSE